MISTFRMLALSICIFSCSPEVGRNDEDGGAEKNIDSVDLGIVNDGAEKDIASVDFRMDETGKGAQKKQTLLRPLGNKIYHAAFPDFGGSEDQVSVNRIMAFESMAQKPLTWAYFSNNWSEEKGIHFPSKDVKVINDFGRVPFIRLMARSNFDEGGPDPLLSIDVLLSGEKDEALRAWARTARDAKIPLLAEFGTEVNGDWFSWNAKWNGAGEKEYGDPDLYDGMEKFRDLYRKIINICRDEGALNITWFFHVDAYSSPREDWNKMPGYYPGDDYIDWIGLSVYGPQRTDLGWWSFESLLDDNWDEISQISQAGKPLALLEWGVVEGEDGQKAKWIEEAMATILPGGAYENKFSAVSYWHENFDQSRLRIDTDPKSLSAYQKMMAKDIFVNDALFE